MSKELDTIETTLSHLPKISEVGKLLDGPTASRVRAIVERQNGGLGRLIDAQINQVSESLESELMDDGDGQNSFMKLLLRGVIARSVIYGVSQAIYAAAESIEEGERMDAIFFSEELPN